MSAEKLSHPFRRIILVLAAGAILLGFFSFEQWVAAGDWIAPREGLRDKTILLLSWLRFAVPAAGMMSALLVAAPARWRVTLSGGLRRVLTSRWTLPLILFINLSLSTGWLVFFPNTMYADSVWYFDHAAWLADGYGYVYDLQTMNPTAAYPVGYPFFLSLVFRLTGPTLWAAKLANVLLFAGSVYFTFKIVNAVVDTATAALAAFFTATLPGLVVYTSLVNSDLLFLFLSLVIWARVLTKQASRSGGLLTGLLIGFAALVRPAGLLLIPFWILVGIARQRKEQGLVSRSSMFWAAGIVLSAALIVTPWTFRNHSAFGKWIPVSNNGGINFWMGSNPRAYGGFVGLFYERSPFTPLIGDEIAFNETAAQLGWNYFQANPIRVVSLIPAKVFYLLNSNDAGLEWNYSSGIVRPQFGVGPRAFAFVNFIYTLEMGLAFLAVIILLFKRETLWIYRLGIAFGAYWIALHLPFFGKDRFMLPVLPFLLCYSAAGVLVLFNGSHDSIP